MITNKLKIVLPIVNYCNLNCAGCNHFSPLVKEKKYISSDVLENLITQMKKGISEQHILKFHLAGGEPLLHPDFTNIVKITKKLLPCTQIIVMSNGTLIDDDIIRFLKKYDIQLLVSDYPVKKHDSLNLVDRNLFRFHYISDEYYENKKCEFFGTYANCLQLNWNGDLYFCCIPANIESYNKYYSKSLKTIENDDYINIFSDEFTYLNIVMKYNKKRNFCNFCKQPELLKWHVFNNQNEWFV